MSKDYKKLYEEALERARDLHDNHPLGQPLTWVTCEDIFPELRESEDERIRKGLIKGLSAMRDIHKHQTFSDDAINIDDAIAWLEKQGEKKPAELAKGEDYGIDGLYAAIDILQKTLGEVDGYQTDDGILEHECAISAIKKLSKRKPAWSEEDEKQIRQIERIVKDSGASTNLQKKISDWLKSLKPQHHWKPSEYDISLLEEIARNIRNNVRPFCSEVSAFEDLIENLKKL